MVGVVGVWWWGWGGVRGYNTGVSGGQISRHTLIIGESHMYDDTKRHSIFAQDNILSSEIYIYMYMYIDTIRTWCQHFIISQNVTPRRGVLGTTSIFHTSVYKAHGRTKHYEHTLNNELGHRHLQVIAGRLSFGLSYCGVPNTWRFSTHDLEQNHI